MPLNFENNSGEPRERRIPDLHILRERIIRLSGFYGLLFGTPLLILVISRGFLIGWDWGAAMQVSAYLLLLGAVVFGKQIGSKVQGFAVLGVLATVSIAGIANWGVFSQGPILIVGCGVLAAIFLSVRWAIGIVGFLTMLTGLIAWGYSTGTFQYSFDKDAYVKSGTLWLLYGGTTLMVGCLMSIAISWVTKSLQTSITTLRKHEEELEASNRLLQHQAVQLEEQATQLEEQADCLKEERDKAQAASRAKDQFLAVISHELRTPLNPVIGFLDIIKDESHLSEENRNQLDLMQKSSEHLLHLIDQVVDFSELDRGELSVKKTQTSLSELKSETAFRLASQARDHQLDFELSCEPDEAEDVFIDKKRLLQVIDEIGSNAIKFTHQGSVRVSIRLAKSNSGDHSTLNIRVSDTGIGIDADKIDSLFDPFTQAESTKTRSFGGFGLGLAFCQKIVSAFDGSIQIESQLGIGTTVHIEIPVETAIAAKAETIKPRRSKLKLPNQLEVLVVEDDNTNQKVISSLLKRMGATATCADNGRIALDILDQRHFDAILMDLSMPEMDGITATKEIKRRPETASIPIIALTAHSYSSSEAECMEAGMSAFLTKPVKQAKLFETLCHPQAPVEKVAP